MSQSIEWQRFIHHNEIIVILMPRRVPPGRAQAGLPTRIVLSALAGLLSVLVGNYDRSTVLDAQMYSRLHQKFGEHLSKAKIPRGVKMREATSHHTTIFEHAPTSEHAIQFQEFTREVVARIERSFKAQAEETAEAAQAQPVAATDDEFAMGELSNG